MTPFDFIKAITETKDNLLVGTDNDELAEKDYNPFIVNRGLSFFPDTVLYANEMNVHHTLDKSLQFLFLLNSIRPRKRYSKWLKKEKVDAIEMISECFGYSLAKSKDVVNLLSDEQLKLIKTKLEKGGVNTKEKQDASKRGNTTGSEVKKRG